MFTDMFQIHMQLMQRLDQWNECVYMYYACMYVRMYVCVCVLGHGSKNQRKYSVLYSGLCN